MLESELRRQAPLLRYVLRAVGERGVRRLNEIKATASQTGNDLMNLVM